MSTLTKRAIAAALVSVLLGFAWQGQGQVIEALIAIAGMNPKLFVNEDCGGIAGTADLCKCRNMYAILHSGGRSGKGSACRRRRCRCTFGG